MTGGLSRATRPTDEEIRHILRGADSVIGKAGRSMLSKILKGSHDKKLLQLAQELELADNPAYGSLSYATLPEIMDKIDWMIRNRYLKIEYNWKLPVIVFSERGWDIEREARADEFLRLWDKWIERGVSPMTMEYLKDRDRGLITLFLEKVGHTGDTRYIPFLRKWEPIDYRKVRQMIRETIHRLEAAQH